MQLFLVLQVSGYGIGNNIFLPLDVTLAIKRCLLSLNLYFREIVCKYYLL